MAGSVGLDPRIASIRQSREHRPGARPRLLPGVPAAGAGQRQLEKKLGCRQIPFWGKHEIDRIDGRICGAVQVCPASADVSTSHRPARNDSDGGVPVEAADSEGCIMLDAPPDRDVIHGQAPATAPAGDARRPDRRLESMLAGRMGSRAALLRGNVERAVHWPVSFVGQRGNSGIRTSADNAECEPSRETGERTAARSPVVALSRLL